MHDGENVTNLYTDIDLPLEDMSVRLDEHGPVFILGCPRSGTTFLSTCIGAMPNVSEFIGRLAPPSLMHLLGRRIKDGLDVSEEMSVMREIFWLNFIQRCFHREERIGYNYKSVSGFFSQFKDASLDGQLFCYKEPFAGFGIKGIVQEFPKAKYIHIVRDGRDNADSLERRYPHSLADHILTNEDICKYRTSDVGSFECVDGFCYPWWVLDEERYFFKNSSRYVRNVMLWKKLVSDVDTELQTVDSDRVLVIRYEDIVGNQIKAAQSIAEFLGAPVTRKFLSSLKSGHQKSVQIFAKRDDWSEVEFATDIAKPLLDKYGYDTPSKPSLTK